MNRVALKLLNTEAYGAIAMQRTLRPKVDFWEESQLIIISAELGEAPIMMNRVLLAGVAVTAMVLAAPQASSADYTASSGTGYKPYVSLFGGASWLTKNPHGYATGGPTPADLLMNNPGYIIGGAVGVDWGNQLRTELELSYSRWTSDKAYYSSTNHTAKSDVTATYLIGNAWYDIKNGSMITPYIGGGVGVGWTNINAFQGTGLAAQFNSSGLAFQLGAGLRFNVSENVAIDAGYRFKDIVGLNYNSSNPSEVATDTSLASHNFQIGLTLQF